MSGGQPKTLETKTTQTSEPLGMQRPFYEDLYKRASDAMALTNNNPFKGNFVATTGTDFAGGVDALRGIIPGLGAGGKELQELGVATARGDFLRPESNPFLASAGQAAIRPLQQQFTDIVLPGITDRAIAEGAYGGSGQDISQERAATGLATASGDILSNMYLQNYQFERGNQNNAGAILGQAGELLKAPGMAGLMLDEVVRGGKQLTLDNQIAKFNERNRVAPWYGLGEMANILASGGFKTGTTNQTAPNPNYVDPLTNALKLMIGGGAAVAGMGGAGGFNLWGPAAAGARA